ncbi:MAG TPA: DUF1028 domain-containing protein [Rhodospirillales bacterium]|nr:DUF1028 domain-containing protein [Rhodospirillales bacterium]
MTLSLVARCERTGQFGAVIASSSMAVAARCIHVRAGAGAVATQNVTDPRLGPRALGLLERGHGAQRTLDELVRTSRAIEWRQLAIVDAQGRAAAFTGERALGLHAAATADNAVAAGNLLANATVPKRMLEAFLDSGGELADRLVAALCAGRDAGGERSPLHASGLLVADRVSWPVTDLRVDWSDGDPVADLEALWHRWKPQYRDYVLRALEPEAAPGF